MPEPVRLRLFVSGKVQGVWFRESTREQAESIGGLVGWVRNLQDGRVEVLVQGAPEAVDRLVAFCRAGPPAAEVAGVEVADETPGDDLDGFRVRR